MPKRTGDYESWQLSQLTDPRAAASYLNAALEDSVEMFRIAVVQVAKAHQVSKVAQGAGVTRENIYRAFSASGNPTLDTLVSVLRELNLELDGVRPIVGESVFTPSAASPARTVSARRNVRTRRKNRRFVELSNAGQLQLSFGAAINTVPETVSFANDISPSTASRLNDELLKDRGRANFKREEWAHFNQGNGGRSAFWIPNPTAMPQRTFPV